MKYDAIRYRVENDIAVVTLNRPKVMNALTIQMRAEIENAFQRAAKEARVVVMTGKDRAFCTGQDLGDRTSAADVDMEQSLKKTYQPMLEAIFNCPIPTISAVARIIDRRFYSAAMYWTAGGIMVLFGFMHSPLNGDKMFWPWQIGMVTEFDGTVVFKPEVQQAVIQFAVAYFVMAGLMLALGFMLKQEPINSDEEFEQYYDH